MAKSARWVITASGERPFAELRKDLKKAGFTIDQALEEIGVITGDSDEGVAQKVRKVAGVADVSKDGTVDVGPPGSDKTW